MTTLSRTAAGFTAFTLCLGATSTCLAGPPEYRITDLGTLRGFGSQGWGVNDDGEVTGSFDFELTGEREPGTATHAFLYSAGIMHDLGTLGRDFSMGEDINASGVVVGTSDTVDSQRAFLYRDGVMLDLGELAGNPAASTGQAINDRGEVTGGIETEEGTSAYVFAEGTLEVVPAPPEARGCEALLFVGYGINDATQVTGELGRQVPGGCRAAAFLYDHASGEMLLIGDLLPDHSSAGHAINDSGEVVMFGITTGDSGSYLYSDGQVERIGGERSLIAWDIDEAGRVVGQTGLGGAESRAFLYVNGRFHELDERVRNPDGWQHLDNALAISDSGYITGYGTTDAGDTHAFLLTPLAVEVDIDVRPRKPGNQVNLRRNGLLAVAVFSTARFDASQVNWETVRFGRGEAREAHGHAHFEDADGDGAMDFVAHFRIRAAAIRCRDTSVTLTGATFDGGGFRGVDDIEVVQCR
jgi:probable HAF family extracellular repeat protein